MLRLLPLLLLLGFGGELCAQTDLLPVRRGGLWGLIDTAGTVLLPPTYDAIRAGRAERQLANGQVYYPVRRGTHWGLIDSGFQEVLPPIFTDVRAFGGAWYGVKAQTDGGWNVSSTDGQLRLPRTYPTLRPLGGNYLVFFEEEKGGVLRLPAGAEQFRGDFDRIELLCGNLAAARDTSRLFTLYRMDGTKVSPRRYLQVAAINDAYFIASQQPNDWQLYDRNGNRLDEQKYARFERFRGGIFRLEIFGGRNRLFHSGTGRLLPDRYSLIRDEYPNTPYLLVRSGDSEGLLNVADGQFALPTGRYRRVYHLRDDLFVVEAQTQLTGLYQIGVGEIVPPQFEDILAADGPLLHILDNGQEGLYRAGDTLVVPTEFERIKLDFPYARAYPDDSTMVLYEFEENTGALLATDRYEQVYTVSVGYRLQRIGVPGDAAADPSAPPMYTDYPYPTRGVDLQRESRYQFRYDSLRGRYALWDTETATPLTHDAFSTTVPLPNTALTMVFRPAGAEEVVQREQTSTSGIHTKLEATLFVERPLYEMALFSHRTGKFVSDFDYLGLRWPDFDAGLPYAAVVDKYGDFALVDTAGVLLTQPDGAPLRFAYIGVPTDGIAEVAATGSYAARGGLRTVGRVHQLQYAYHLHTARFVPDQAFSIGKSKYSAARWGLLDYRNPAAFVADHDYISAVKNGVRVEVEDGRYGTCTPDGDAVIPATLGSLSWFQDTLLLSGTPISRPLLLNDFGQEIVGLQYEHAGEYRGAHCAVQREGFWGFVNERGFETIPCQYDTVGYFNEGLAPVRTAAGWQFVDSLGLTAIELPPDVQYAEPFHNGRARILRDSLHGYIDREGREVIPTVYTLGFHFENGVARVVQDAKTGLLGPDGQWVMAPANYEFIRAFDAGGLTAAKEDYVKGQSALLDKSGKQLSPLRYDAVYYGDGRYVRVRTSEGVGYADAAGRELVPPVYTAVGEWGEGLLAVLPKESPHWHYVDTAHQTVIDLSLLEAGRFENGYALVVIEESGRRVSCLLDKYGRLSSVLAEPGYYLLSAADKRLTWRAPRRDRGIADPRRITDLTGRFIGTREYSAVEPYAAGTAVVRFRGRQGLIDAQGRWRIPARYRQLTRQEDGLFRASPGQLYGLWSPDGRRLMEDAHDAIQALPNGLLRANLGDRVGYYRLGRGWIWAVER